MKRASDFRTGGERTILAMTIRGKYPASKLIPAVGNPDGTNGFQNDFHRTVFVAIKALHARNEPVNVASVYAALTTSGAVVKWTDLDDNLFEGEEAIATFTKIPSVFEENPGNVDSYLRIFWPAASTTERPWTEHWPSIADLGWSQRTPPPREFLILDTRSGKSVGVFPRGRAGMLVGPGGVGKSWGKLQLAVAAATGTLWLDTFEVKAEGHILAMFAEEEPDELWRRYYVIEQHLLDNGMVDKARLTAAAKLIVPLALAGRDVKLTRRLDRGEAGLGETPLVQRIRDRLLDRPSWSLLMFDPFARFSGADAEADNDAATNMVTIFESFGQVAGKPNLLVSHHTTKESRRNEDDVANAGRGASGLYDGFRWQPVLKPRREFDGAPRLLNLHFAKGNYSGPIPKLTLIADPERDGMLRPAKPIEIDTYERVKRAASAEPSGSSDKGPVITPKMRERA